MNKFLKSAVERYEKIRPKEYLINPISVEDGEIMVEVMQILKKNHLEDIFQILSQYKELKDEDIRDQLMQWNIDHPFGAVKELSKKEKEVINEQPVKYAPFIKIQNLIIKIYDLHGIELYERVDEEDCLKYGVIINPTPEHVKQIPFYSNHKIEWFIEENRNEVLEQLKAVLEEQGSDLLDLNSNEQ